jgi:hypothetical protein
MNIIHRDTHEPTGTWVLSTDVVYYTSIIRITQAEQRAGASMNPVVPPELLNVQDTNKRVVSPHLPIERFDGYDAKTGDYVIMFRVPYQEPDLSNLETTEMPVITPKPDVKPE